MLREELGLESSADQSDLIRPTPHFHPTHQQVGGGTIVEINWLHPDV